MQISVATNPKNRTVRARVTSSDCFEYIVLQTMVSSRGGRDFGTLHVVHPIYSYIFIGICTQGEQRDTCNVSLNAIARMQHHITHTWGVSHGIYNTCIWEKSILQLCRFEVQPKEQNRCRCWARARCKLNRARCDHAICNAIASVFGVNTLNFKPRVTWVVAKLCPCVVYCRLVNIWICTRCEFETRARLMCVLTELFNTIDLYNNLHSFKNTSIKPNTQMLSRSSLNTVQVLSTRTPFVKSVCSQ